MQPRVPKYLFDIRSAIDAIFTFTAARTADDYLHDLMLRSAVERQFEIIGEALNQMFQFEPALMSRISFGRQIVAFRNRLIHNYWNTSHGVVWDIIQADLPLLRNEIEPPLAEVGPPPTSP